MKNLIPVGWLVFGILLISAPVRSQQYIADYTVAKEEVLRSIPVEFINKAKAELVVAYQHTSHGTHVSRGMFGLPSYKAGDQELFGLSATPAANRLEFRDFALEDYAPEGVTSVDLGNTETAFVQTTRNYLDAPENATVNVVMWAWSRITDHDVAGTYLPGMDSLIGEYGAGGTKIGTGAGQREIPVTFIYMTGHSIKDENTGPLNPKEQAALINNYCVANQLFSHDYYSIDTHAMDDTYYEDTGDNGDSDTYGGNFYEDWQNSHTLGVDYYENWHTMEGHVAFGVHTTQHITSNRKAYAMWWILARLVGWSGGVQVTSVEVTSENNATSVMTGGELQFSASILPEDATNPTVNWSVINKTGSGTITSGGLLTAGLPGEVDVVALAQGLSDVGDTMTITIIESEVPVTSITISSAGEITTIEEQASLQCSATVMPADATNISVVWSVVNGTGTATISSAGLVTATSAGSVEVVATALDGTNTSGTLSLTINGPNGLLNEKSSNSIVIYPNPGPDRFFIENKQNNISEIRVFDGNGREVLRVSPSEITSRTAIDLSGNSPGIYGVVVSDNQQKLSYSKLVLIK